MKKGVIVRVKKGLYVFGNQFRARPYSRELLANLIYGPSFVSLESALAFHGLIPERVTAITPLTPIPNTEVEGLLKYGSIVKSFLRL